MATLPELAPAGGVAMPTLINGAPTHALIVHAVVVFLPLAVVAALVLVFIPSSRRAFGLVSVGIAFIGCAAVPLAFLSGSKLRRRVPGSPLISHHVALAHQLLPVAAIFGLAFAAFVGVDVVRRARRDDLNRVEEFLLGLTGLSGASHSAGSPSNVSQSAGSLSGASRVCAGLLVVMAVATAVAVVRVGDSGAKAVWHGRLSTSQYSQ